MFKEPQIHRYAEYVDNNLESLLPGAIHLWQQHYNLIQKSLHVGLDQQETDRINAMADYRLHVEEVLVPYLITVNQKILRGWHPIYEIDELIKKKNWMPNLLQRQQRGTGDFYRQPFADQIQAVLLYTMAQIDLPTLNRILTTPCLAEQKFVPGKTVRFIGNLNLSGRD
ncbi:MAG: hypothetical protein II942_04575 [Alphaproteobacteria bacterium]|nr:hypothetical protein [Alphaproteobacteria bacterium]